MQNQGNQAETSGIAPHVADILSFYDNITIPIKVVGNEPLIENLKTSLDAKFSVKDFGPIHYYLGIEFLRNKDGLALTQRKYALDLVTYASLLDVKPSAAPLDLNKKLTLNNEAEYRAPADSTCKVTWIQCLLKEFQINVPTFIPIICHNASSIALASNPVHHARSKHIEIDCHFVRDKELTRVDIKRMDIHDQAIQTILLGLPEDVYAAVDSCETAKEIWERVRQMIKGSDIREQEKKAKLFNEWERFTSTDGESIESYYHRFMQLMNDLKRNKHFPENIASNLKFLNNLQTEWKRHVTIVRQTKNLYEADFTQIYNFLKMNQDESGRIQGAQNAVQNAGVQNGRNRNGLVVVPGIANQNGTSNVVAAKAEGTRIGNQARHYNCRGLGHITRNCTARPRRRDAAYLQTQLLISQKEEAGIQLQAEEFNFMAAAGDLDKIKEVNANCILMKNLQHASISGTQLDKAPVYDTDGSAEVQLNDNCYDNEIFNMFTKEEQYTDLLEPIPEPQLVSQNDNPVTSVAPSMVQSGGTVETSSAPNEETRAHQETVYRNLGDQVA
nr:uncharacterized mitochondrial protein AtMg00810-like [Tanacetum cinerariifolium]